MVIAFIPVRGGSKSIPLKNIKPFCGKPLVCWSIEALECCSLVDEVIVATDSDLIEKTVSERSYTKTRIYRRSAENACDTSSTESVMIEYINYARLSGDIIFLLVQVTSPLTGTVHFSEALHRYMSDKQYDSMLTCVRNYRFFWNADGTSRNYDYMNRPRRQNFSGELMENGAFYINTVGNILKNGNRLSGRIGIYEMPEYTAVEIDEPDDWAILEKLMMKYVLSKRGKIKKNIKLFLSDVDGTLTDGGMYYSENGDELKKFNTRDGMGFQLLREAGIKTGIVTSEKTMIVENRAKKLKIDYLVQGKRSKEKLEAVKEICKNEGFSLGEVAYIGDDLNCYDLLCAVGVSSCPADACYLIKKIPGIEILNRCGGNACVREFIEKLCF
ncbi:cytidylyltransferase domain-containing protein [Phocaeicola sp.]